jgi:hypothetical protein
VFPINDFVIKEYSNLIPVTKKHNIRILSCIRYQTIFFNEVPFFKNFPCKNLSDRHGSIQLNPSTAPLSNQYRTPASHSEAIFTSKLHQATLFVTLKQYTYTIYTAHLITQHMPPFSWTTYLRSRIREMLRNIHFVASLWLTLVTTGIARRYRATLICF